MSTSLSRLLISVTNFSAANHALNCTNAQPLACSASASVTRFICSTTRHFQSQQDNSVKEQTKALQENRTTDNTQGQEEQDSGDDDDVHVNEETGEVGGPKGPEPTRYGDWERNGRCYDF
ncbi:succinate dehydrogenase assembly factor 4, mitochondrial [Neltuma alba]|uniref:succinate dehydrogenase assembly factor 4, mitochondrial n=1 Tax=Neltuma alba TaxID=207710 RepID=UPI0010A3A1AD|nr:succinate dehydrogenase assembly factor 4, mitochondrial [Prosopis alba]